MKNNEEKIQIDECLKPCERYLFHQKRTLVINGEINDEVANKFACLMRYLADQNPYEEIVLEINCFGGNVVQGMKMFDTINYVPCDVRTICYGMAFSMGAFLLSAGTRGKRQSMPNGEIMIHQPLGGAQGQVSDLMIQMRHAENTRKTLNEYMSIFTDKPLKQIEKDTDRDYYMSPKEALDYGIIDNIITSEIKAGKSQKMEMG